MFNHLSPDVYTMGPVAWTLPDRNTAWQMLRNAASTDGLTLKEDSLKVNLRRETGENGLIITKVYLRALVEKPDAPTEA